MWDSFFLLGSYDAFDLNLAMFVFRSGFLGVFFLFKEEEKTKRKIEVFFWVNFCFWIPCAV